MRDGRRRLTAEDFLYGEFALIKGDLLLALGDAEGAGALFEKVISVTGKPGLRTRSCELPPS